MRVSRAGSTDLDGRGLAVLDPFRSRAARLRREGVGGVADRDDVARVQEIVAVDRADRLLAELAGVETLLLGELVDQVDVGVGAVDDQRRLRRAVAVAPRVPLLDDPAHRLGAGVVELERLVLLEDRDGVDPAAFVDRDLVVAQPRVRLAGLSGSRCRRICRSSAVGIRRSSSISENSPGRRIASC